MHHAFRDALDGLFKRQVMERFNLPRLDLDTTAFAASQLDAKAAERAGLAFLPTGDAVRQRAAGRA